MSAKNTFVAASIFALASASVGSAQNAVMHSAGALAFDASNTLFVGDGKSGVVHAFDLSNVVADQSAYQLGRAQTFDDANAN